MPTTLIVTAGLAKNFLLQKQDGRGVAYGVLNPSPFLSTDTLACSLWPGGTLTPVATPTLTWVDATGLATYRMHLAAADTAALEGVYYYSATVARGAGEPQEIGKGRLRVEVGPGLTAEPLAYTTRDDLLTYAPWLEDLQVESDEVGFGVEQERATNHLIDAILNHWKIDMLRPTMGQPGWNAQSLGYTSANPQSWWLRQQLVPLVPNSGPNAAYPDRMTFRANKVDPRVSTALLLYQEVKEICARWAIGYVCDAQIGRAGERSYWEMGDRFRSQGDALFRCCKFQIDLTDPQTGYASITVNGGGGSVR